MFECCFTCGYSHSLTDHRSPNKASELCAVFVPTRESSSVGVNPAGLRKCCTIPSVPSEPSSELCGLFLSF